uniref:profilin-2-like n=1 Tax=Callithrix jacchus TaxID=9483 RepID=UPI0004F02E1B|nr:profilin-2-like [Callithrix jacchus]
MQCIRDISEEVWKDCITMLLQTGIKCLLIRDNLYAEGNNTMDLRTKGQSRSSRAVTVVQIESVWLVVIGQKGTEGGPLNLKAFEMAGYIREAIQQHVAHF